MLLMSVLNPEQLKPVLSHTETGKHPEEGGEDVDGNEAVANT